MHFFASSNLQIISSRWVSLLCLNTSALIFFRSFARQNICPQKLFSPAVVFLMWFFNWIFSHYYYQTWTKSSTVSLYPWHCTLGTCQHVCMPVESVCANSLIIRKGSASNLSYKSSFYPIYICRAYRIVCKMHAFIFDKTECKIAPNLRVRNINCVLTL